MTDETGMGASEWIALGALGIAALSWVDSVRRINASAIKFQIEYGDSKGWYRLRNIGTRSAGFTQIDPASVQSFELGLIAFSSKMRPGESFSFQLTSSTGKLPDTIGVSSTVYRKVTRIIPFQPVDVSTRVVSKATEQ